MSASQSRKWQLTMNNPLDVGMTRTAIVDTIASLAPDYWCVADEVATTGTPHAHIYIYRKSPIRFRTIQSKFPSAHIEQAYGTSNENRDYIAKTGKWTEHEKENTIIKGSFQEGGQLPAEEKSPSNYELIKEIEAGKTTSEIILSNPAYVFRSRDIDVLRQTLLSASYDFRNITVNYIYGATGTGKTRSIYQHHPAADICRVTNYNQTKGIQFDNYHHQRVLVFEEFHSQIPIADMLNYLDIYPLTLPARYSDRTAMYETVYITSNLPLEAQYESHQISAPEVWNAFLRRIHNVYEYKADGTIIVIKEAKPLTPEEKSTNSGEAASV